jgi:hypothetical protein
MMVENQPPLHDFQKGFACNFSNGKNFYDFSFPFLSLFGDLSLQWFLTLMIGEDFSRFPLDKNHRLEIQ